jgi:hypothetical protein
MNVKELQDLLKTCDPDRKVVLTINEGDHQAVGEVTDARPSVIGNDQLILEATESRSGKAIFCSCTCV